MPRCNHKEAVCVIGDFWTCKTAGCDNGPKAEKPRTEKPRQLEFTFATPVDVYHFAPEWLDDFITEVTK